MVDLTKEQDPVETGENNDEGITTADFEAGSAADADAPAVEEDAEAVLTEEVKTTDDAIEVAANDLPVEGQMFIMETITDTYNPLAGGGKNTIRKMSAKYAVFAPGQLVLMEYKTALDEAPFARELLRVSGMASSNLANIIHNHCASNHGCLNEADLHTVLLGHYGNESQQDDFVAIYFA